MFERSANGAAENKLYTQSYEIFGVIWGAIVYAYWLSGRAEWESILPSVLAYEPSTATCLCQDQERGIFPIGPA